MLRFRDRVSQRGHPWLLERKGAMGAEEGPEERVAVETAGAYFAVIGQEGSPPSGPRDLSPEVARKQRPLCAALCSLLLVAQGRDGTGDREEGEGKRRMEVCLWSNAKCG